MLSSIPNEREFRFFIQRDANFPLPPSLSLFVIHFKVDEMNDWTNGCLRRLWVVESYQHSATTLI